MDLSNAQWRKSSYSGSNAGNCVEVAQLPGIVAVRDSKDPEGGALIFPPDTWRGFVAGLKEGRLRP